MIPGCQALNQLQWKTGYQWTECTLIYLKFFPEPPFIAYKRQANLKDKFIRARLKKTLKSSTKISTRYEHPLPSLHGALASVGSQTTRILALQWGNSDPWQGTEISSHDWFTLEGRKSEVWQGHTSRHHYNTRTRPKDSETLTWTITVGDELCVS